MEIIEGMKESDKLQLVNNNHSQSKAWLDSCGYLANWKDFYDLYRNIPKSKSENWMSNKFVPMTHSQVEAAYSNLLGLFFAVNPPFDVKARNEGNDMAAMHIKKLLQYQMELAGFNTEFQQFLRSLCIFGTGIGKIIWERKWDMRKEWVVQTEPMLNLFGVPIGQREVGSVPVDKQYLSFNQPMFFNCNIGDIFPDPMAIDIQDSWIIHRTYRAIDYLRQMHNNHPEVYNENVLKIVDADAVQNNKGRDDIQGSLGLLNYTAVDMPKGAGQIELLERWGLDIDPEDGVLKPRVLTVAAGKYLIRNTNNPYWHGKNPFVKASYIPSLNEFYGIGIPEIVEDCQTSVNETVNQRNDNISLALNRIILYKRGANVKMSNLKSAPGIKIGTDEEIDSSIRFIETPLYCRDTFIHAQEFERWAQESTAITKMTLGMGSKQQNDTATGMSLLQRASGDRFMAIAKVIENCAFKEILRQWYQLNYQFIEDDVLFQIVGMEGSQSFRVNPSDVRKDYEFIPAGLFTMENRGQKALRLIQYKNITQNDPTIKQTALNEKIFKAMEIGDDPRELIREDAEVQEIANLAKMFAMQMLQQQAEAEPKKTPGMGGKGQIMGTEKVGTPGVPPMAPAVAPGDRV